MARNRRKKWVKSESPTLPSLATSLIFELPNEVLRTIALHLVANQPLHRILYLLQVSRRFFTIFLPYVFPQHLHLELPVPLGLSPSCDDNWWNLGQLEFLAFAVENWIDFVSTKITVTARNRTITSAAEKVIGKTIISCMKTEQCEIVVHRWCLHASHIGKAILRGSEERQSRGQGPFDLAVDAEITVNQPATKTLSALLPNLQSLKLTGRAPYGRAEQPVLEVPGKAIPLGMLEVPYDLGNPGWLAKLNPALSPECIISVTQIYHHILPTLSMFQKSTQHLRLSPMTYYNLHENLNYFNNLRSLVLVSQAGNQHTPTTLSSEHITRNMATLKILPPTLTDLHIDLVLFSPSLLPTWLAQKSVNDTYAWLPRLQNLEYRHSADPCYQWEPVFLQLFQPFPGSSALGLNMEDGQTITANQYQLLLEKACEERSPPVTLSRETKPLNWFWADRKPKPVDSHTWEWL